MANGQTTSGWTSDRAAFPFALLCLAIAGGTVVYPTIVGLFACFLTGVISIAAYRSLLLNAFRWAFHVPPRPTTPDRHAWYALLALVLGFGVPLNYLGHMVYATYMQPLPARQFVGADLPAKQPIFMSPDLLLLYKNGKLVIYNYGPQDIFLWGDDLGGFSPAIESDPVIIPYLPPPEIGFYYIYTDKLKKFMVQNIGQNGQKLIPFQVYLKDKQDVEYIGNFSLLVTMANGQMNIDTQEHGVSKDNWSTNPPAAPPQAPAPQ